MTRAGRTAPPPGTPPSGTPGWLVVSERECRDLWVGGRGPLLLLAYGLLLSVVTYLLATGQALNYLERRESVDLLLQVSVAVGVLLALVVGADGISGERERGTLETLLLTPVSRRHVTAGKLVAALSLWSAAFVVALPYLWVLGRGVSAFVPAALAGLLVGTVLAGGLASVGLVVSGLAASNRTSLAAGLLLLLALFAPTQLPAGARQGRLGDLLVRLDPIGSGLHYSSGVVLSGHRWARDLTYLVSPVLTAAVAGAVLLIAAGRLVGLNPGRATG